jgi:hypothetical protein
VGAQPVAEMPQKGGSGESPGGNVGIAFHFQMSAATFQGHFEVGIGCKNFATIVPEVQNNFNK